VRRPVFLLLAPLALVLAGVAAHPVDEKTDPKQALLDAYRGLKNLKSYRIIATTTAKTTSTTTLEYVAPDRYRMVTDRAETVVTRGATYIRYKNGRWAIAPVDVSELIARFHDPKEVQEIADPAASRDFKSLGPEVFDGASTFVYQYTTVVEGQKSVAKVWLLAESGLPRKKETDSEYGSEKVRSVQVFEYDRDIMIDPPIHG
jgi:outer membrane lipoprotein-sorting protein